MFNCLLVAASITWQPSWCKSRMSSRKGSRYASIFETVWTTEISKQDETVGRQHTYRSRDKANQKHHSVLGTQLRRQVQH
jgi:hypothetical protein